MNQQASLYFYKFRYYLAGILTIAFLMLISAIVTSVGSNTVLNDRSHPSISIMDPGDADGPNVLTNGSYVLGADAQKLLLTTGTTLYGTCRSINFMTTSTGKATIHVGADILGGAWDGVAFVGRGFGDSIMFVFHGVGDVVMYTVRTPGRIVGSLTSGHAVSDIIKPTDGSKNVPIISNETSAVALASLDAAQQQEIVKLQAAQLVDNQRLNGEVIAGDPNHGGYPDRWNDAPQDSLLDSWGMYNRECVSYTAWKVYQTYGNMPYWGGVGNANQWVGDAERAGIPVSSTPKVHSVAIWRVGYYGHAMWVEAVNGNMVYVSQYNYDLNGHYSEMWVNGSQFTYIYFH